MCSKTSGPFEIGACAKSDKHGLRDPPVTVSTGGPDDLSTGFHTSSSLESSSLDSRLRDHLYRKLEAAKNRRKQPFLAVSDHKKSNNKNIGEVKKLHADSNIVASDPVSEQELNYILADYRYHGVDLPNGKVLIYLGDYNFKIANRELTSHHVSINLPLDTNFKSVKGGDKLISVTYLHTVQLPGKVLVVNKEVEYLDVLLLYLRSKFGIVANELRNYNAMLSTLYTKIPQVPQEWVYGSFLVYVQSIQGLIVHHASLEGPRACEIAVSQSVEMVTGKVEPVYSIPCTLSNTWTFNSRWTIKSSYGFMMDYSGIILHRYPTFNTPSAEDSKFRQISMCRLLGIREFAYYDVSGENACQALARYMKARPDEEGLFQRQLLLLTHSLGFYNLPRFLALGGAVLTDNCVVFKPTILTKTSSGRSVKKSLVSPLDHTDNRWFAFTRYLTRVSSPYNRYDYFSYLLSKFMRWGKQLIVEGLGGYKRTIFVEMPMKVACRVYDSLYMYYDRYEWLKDRVSLPHPKSVMYFNYINVPRTLDQILSNSGDFESKVKKEAGKPGKVPRLYGSAGPLCLVDPNLPEVAKCALSEFPIHEYIGNSAGLKFYIINSSAQSRIESDSLINKVLNMPVNCIYFVIFSDDGFLIHHDARGRFKIFETDISSCDSSNGPGVFALAWYMCSRLSSVENADALISQCTRPTTLRNPSNKEEYVVLEPMFAFEYSGSVLTTFLNTLASFAIGFSIYLKLLDNMQLFLFDGKTDLSNIIPRAALDCGWVVTCIEKKNFNSVAFLKRSFSGLVSWKNYGCIFRSLGMFEGGSLCAEHFGLTCGEFRSLTNTQLFEKHLLDRLLCEVNEPVSIVTNAWRERCGLPVLPIELPLSSLQERYGGSDYEWYEFCSIIHTLKLGSTVQCAVLVLIYMVDYSLE